MNPGKTLADGSPVTSLAQAREAGAAVIAYGQFINSILDFIIIAICIFFVDDFDNYLLIAEIGAEASLTQKLSLRVYLQDIYDNQPAPGREKNDLKLVSGLAYKF